MMTKLGIRLLILLFGLSTKTVANASCEFPWWVQPEYHDQIWVSRLSESSYDTADYLAFEFHEDYFHEMKGKTSELIHSYNCIQKASVRGVWVNTTSDHFILSVTINEDSQAVVKYTCWRFFRRSQSIIQFEQSEFGDSPNIDLCTGNLIMNPYPLIRYYHREIDDSFLSDKEMTSPCPLPGGYVFQWMDMNGRSSDQVDSLPQECQDRYASLQPGLWQSGCVQHDSKATIKFEATPECVSSLGERVPWFQRLGINSLEVQCLATWTKDNYTFSIMKQKDISFRSYDLISKEMVGFACIRYNKTVIGYPSTIEIYEGTYCPGENTVAKADDVGTDYLTLTLTRRERNKCGRNDSPFCDSDEFTLSKGQSSCNQPSYKRFCEEKCDGCLENKYVMLPGSLLKKFSDSMTYFQQDSNAFNLKDTWFQYTGSIQDMCCFSLYPKKNFGGDMYLFDARVSNHCDPYEMCVSLVQRGPDVVQFQVYLPKDGDCTTGPQEDPSRIYDLRNNFKNVKGGWRNMIRKGSNHESVNCNLDFIFDASASFQLNKEKQCNVTITPSGQKINISFKEGCTPQVKYSEFRCLASFAETRTNVEQNKTIVDTFIITKAKLQNEFDFYLTYQCWYFSSRDNNVFYWTRISDCDLTTYAKIHLEEKYHTLMEPYVPLATFRINKRFVAASGADYMSTQASLVFGVSIFQIIKHFVF
ncbi:unnamed protein product [Owenia fusiformis]|uniref:DUF7043 domain-containing protein n=1 Tax=Owenia fusiformis TaxID=6347 RepID=A0A8J1Y5M7_OWEFU|nr:unnamed protein product [Owenia fusiformis]